MDYGISVTIYAIVCYLIEIEIKSMLKVLLKYSNLASRDAPIGAEMLIWLLWLETAKIVKFPGQSDRLEYKILY